MKSNIDFIEKVKQTLPKNFLISHTGNIVRKRKAKQDEIVINQFIIPRHNRSKRLKVSQSIANLIRRKRARLDDGYLLTPNGRIIKRTDNRVSDFIKAGYAIENNVIIKLETNDPICYEVEYEDFYYPGMFDQN